MFVCVYIHICIYLSLYTHIYVSLNPSVLLEVNVSSVFKIGFICNIDVKLEINLKSNIFFLCGVPLKGNDGKNLT